MPSVLLRFSTLIVTFLTVRLLLKKMEEDGHDAPSLIFTQNVDAEYLNYPKTLQKILSLFPESSKMFHTYPHYLKSIKMLPQLMKTQKILAVAGILLHQEITSLGNFARRVMNQPNKTVVIAGGAKVSDKINVLKQFVQAGVKGIFIGGKMVNTFLIMQEKLLV